MASIKRDSQSRADDDSSGSISDQDVKMPASIKDSYARQSAVVERFVLCDNEDAKRVSASSHDGDSTFYTESMDSKLPAVKQGRNSGASSSASKAVGFSPRNSAEDRILGKSRRSTKSSEKLVYLPSNSSVRNPPPTRSQDSLPGDMEAKAAANGYPSEDSVQQKSLGDDISSRLSMDSGPALNLEVDDSDSRSKPVVTPGAYRQRGPSYNNEEPDSREFMPPPPSAPDEPVSSLGQTATEPESVAAFTTSTGLQSEGGDVVSAALVDDAETVVYAKSVDPDHSRRNLMLVVGVAIVIIIAITVSLSVTLTRKNSNDGDPRCNSSPSQRNIAIECLCEGSTERTFESLNATYEFAYNYFKSTLIETGALDPNLDFDGDDCIPENLAILQMVLVARQDSVGDRVTNILQGSALINYFMQSYALLHFFFSMGGIDWTIGTSWLGDAELLQAEEYTGVQFLFIDDVSQIELPGYNVQGSIPTSIGLLTALRVLDLTGNDGITGQLPSEFGRLRGLRELKLSQTSIEAPPAEILGRLRWLDSLELSGMKMKGNIPNLTLNPFIRNLDLSENGLTGSIPTTIGEVTRLSVVRLSGNQLTGKIPESLVALSYLELLDVSFNSLSGGLPDFLLNVTTLDFANFVASGIGGEVPSEYCDESSQRNVRVIVSCQGNHSVDIESCSCCSSNVLPNADQLRLNCAEDFPADLLARTGIVDL